MMVFFCNPPADLKGKLKEVTSPIYQILTGEPTMGGGPIIEVK